MDRKTSHIDALLEQPLVEEQAIKGTDDAIALDNLPKER
jgi:hypothetical protein